MYSDFCFNPKTFLPIANYRINDIRSLFTVLWLSEMGSVKIKVTDIEGQEHLFVVEHDDAKSIIEIAEENGVELPFSCCSGACFTCCAQVKKGKECLDQEKIGEKLIDTEENEFLCCI